MNVESSEDIPIRTETDVVLCRQRVRGLAAALRFGLVDQTKVVTAASEIARNTLVHGGGGTARLERVSDGIRTGLRLILEDNGPGIPDLQAAFTDGFTTGGGLGLGFGGARRLVSDFQVDTRPGEGTRITLTKWK